MQHTSVTDVAKDFADFMGVDVNQCPACTSEAYDPDEGECQDCGLSVTDYLYADNDYPPYH